MPSDTRPLRIVNQGVVFAGAPGGEVSSATFPLPCVSKTGRWLCAFRGAPSKLRNEGQHVLVTWSDDRGHSWHRPIEPFLPVELEGRPGLMRFAGIATLDDGRLLAAINWVDHSDPSLPYFNETSEGLLDTRIFLSRSEDDGETWSKPRLMDTSPFNVPTPLTGPILRLPDGDLACQFELNKPYDDPEPWRHASVMMFSSDGGRTWPRHSIAAQDPHHRVFYWDQRPAVFPDGRMLDSFWTFDRERATYLNIHAGESRDGGRSWSALWDTGVPGQPGPAFPLEDGSIAMPYVDRTSAPTIKVRRSVDFGRTWPETGERVVFASEGSSQTETKSSMQDAWSEMYKFSVGLPNVAALTEGGALAVYYAGPATDHTAIRWAELR